MKHTFVNKCALLLFILINFEQVIIGQNSFNNGRIVGKVFDQQQSVIIGTKVTVKNLQNNDEIKIESDESGSYEINSLHVGEYEITFNAEGFNKKIETVRVEKNSLIIVNIILAIHYCDDNVISQEQLDCQYCEIHNIKLQKDIVSIIYGLFVSPYSVDQEKTLFPHSSKEFYGGCMAGCSSNAEVLFCSKCREAQDNFDKILTKKHKE